MKADETVDMTFVAALRRTAMMVAVVIVAVVSVFAMLHAFFEGPIWLVGPGLVGLWLAASVMIWDCNR